MKKIVSMCAVAFAATMAVVAAQAPATPAPAAAAAPARQGGRGGGDTPAPARKAGEGLGPFKKMVIRGVTIIDGTGGPPLSPMDIVIEGNRITQVRQARLAGAAACRPTASRATSTSRSTARACT